MTEAEWAECSDPTSMLTFLLETGKVSERKLRLFAVACCRRVWHLLTDERSRNAVEVAERFADGLASAGELAAAGKAAGDVTDAIDKAWFQSDVAAILGEHWVGMRVPERAVGWAAWAAEAAAGALPANGGRHPVFTAAERAAGATGRDGVDINTDVAASEATYQIARRSQCCDVREIFGPLPFRPQVVAPSVLAWNDRLVVRLARAIYEERRWSDMAVLADALLDAGCDNDELVAHLREPTPHARGCFALDLLLSRE